MDLYPFVGLAVGGTGSIAFGSSCTASGNYSQSCGTETIASGYGSHAEGYNTIASGRHSHAEGQMSTASGDYSHAEGLSTYATTTCAHAEGNITTASGVYSHAEGYGTTASGKYSHAEGCNTYAYLNYSHAEGNNTRASGYFSHAEGNSTSAQAYYAHAEGLHTIAMGEASHAEGYGTIALQNQHAQGHYNNTSTAPANSLLGASTGTAFVIGNGSGSTGSNAFRVTGEGLTIGLKAYQTGGADFSEFREWLDGNIENDDRVGYFVTLQGEKIKKANPDDYIRGIISGNPCVIGNGDECWMGRYILDDFGRFIYEEVDEVHTFFDEEGNKQEKIIKVRKMKENTDYDASQEYIPRSERKEWSYVGMVGKLPVRDDGTCKVDGFCKVADGGIATYADWSEGSFQHRVYRVVKRVTENIVVVEI